MNKDGFEYTNNDFLRDEYNHDDYINIFNEIEDDAEKDTNDNWEYKRLVTRIDKAWSKKILELSRKIDSIESKFKNRINKEIDKQRNEKIRFMETIGVFVAIFTFISVNVQILHKATTVWMLLGLSTVMFAGLSFFFFTLIQVTEKWIREDEKYSLFKNYFFWGTVVILVVGAGFLGFGNYIDNYSIQEREVRTEKLEKKTEIIEERIENISNKLELLEIKSRELIK